MAKGVKTGGRVKGTPNKTSLDMRERIEASRDGETLPETLVRWAEELYAERAIADAANVLDKAAKYIYPTLKAIEMSGAVVVEMPLCPEMGPPPIDR